MSIRPVSSSAANVFNQAREGMQRGERKLNQAAGAIASGKVEPGPMVDLIVSEKLYAANATVVRTADQMLGALLDVKR